MNKLKTKEIYEKLNSCNKCGFCQATCRVYKATLNEFNCARGRIRLIKAVADGVLARSRFYEDAVNSCTLCLECTKTCPSAVPTAKLILAARQDLAATKGLPLAKSIALRRVFPSNTMQKMAFRSLKMIKDKKWFREFRGIDLAGLPVADESFINSSQKLPGLKNPRLKAAFFVGCLMSHTIVPTARNLVKVLHANNVAVVVPKEQRCCGTPQFVYGEGKTFGELARHNIELFNKLDVDVVVTGCASCGSMLKNYGDLLENEAAQKLSAKTVDITKFLVDTLQVDLTSLPGIYGKVTYHDPCHLIRSQGIAVQPRRILTSLPGIEYVEMEGADSCCGAGGMFQGFYPEIAAKISQRKLAGVIKAGVDTVVTACPACMLRIQGRLNIGGHKQQVVHLVDVLAKAYEAEKPLAVASEKL